MNLTQIHPSRLVVNKEFCALQLVGFILKREFASVYIVFVCVYKLQLTFKQIVKRYVQITSAVVMTFKKVLY